ncbi:MAG: endonuclease III domain-containing protein [Promethearchaeota archaeon]
MASEDPLTIVALYDALLDEFGPQGWWPLLKSDEGGDRVVAYHPGNYDLPETPGQVLEVFVGTILAQNVAWKNAEKALLALDAADLLSIEALASTPEEELWPVVRPAMYFRQKAARLKRVGRFFSANPLEELERRPAGELRKALLEMNGVGPETADSMLLYGLKRPTFVVDAYTKRILSRLGLIASPNVSYDEVQRAFDALPPSVPTFNEYHALLVKLATTCCTRKDPTCKRCPLVGDCGKIGV